MEVLLGFILVVAAVAVVASPFVRPLLAGDAGDDRRQELELAKQSKYREIRDLELDRNAGKLDEQQWAELDRALRREAMAILAEIDAGSPGESPARAAPARSG